MARRKLEVSYEHPEIEDALKELYGLRDSLSSLNDQRAALRDRIAALEESVEEKFYATGENLLVLDVGEFLVVITPDVKFKEKLNKDVLAQKARLSKDELKTPYDISYWTKKGNLEPRLITESMEPERQETVKIRKRKKRD